MDENNNIMIEDHDYYVIAGLWDPLSEKIHV